MGIVINISNPTIHVYTNDAQEILQKLDQVLSRLEEERVTDLATTQEIRDLLGQINAATDDVANDIEQLLARPEVPDEVRDAAQASLDKLRGVASVYPAPTPTADGGTTEAPGSTEPLPGLEEGATGEVTPSNP